MSKARFDKSFRVRQRLAEKPDHRQHADLLDARFLRQKIKKRRREPEFDFLFAPDLHHRFKKFLARNCVVGDNDFLNFQFANNIRQIIKFPTIGTSSEI